VSTVYILWLRQLKRHSRSRSRILGSLGQPLLFLLALGFGLGPIFARSGEGPYLQFLAPGTIAMALLVTGVFSGLEIIWDRQFGFLRATLVTPVTRLQIVLGRTLGGATVAFIQGTLIFLVCLAAGFRVETLRSLPIAFGFMFLIALLFAAIGTAIASVLEDIQGCQLILNFLVMPLFFFSNSLFPIPQSPNLLRLVVKCNPLSYGVDGLRGALTHGFQFGMGIDFLVMGGLTILFLVIGSHLFSRIEL
jgi:ABC-2 type transport system permease protein